MALKALAVIHLDHYVIHLDHSNPLRKQVITVLTQLILRLLFCKLCFYSGIVSPLFSQCRILFFLLDQAYGVFLKITKTLVLFVRVVVGSNTCCGVEHQLLTHTPTTSSVLASISKPTKISYYHKIPVLPGIPMCLRHCSARPNLEPIYA